MLAQHAPAGSLAERPNPASRSDSRFAELQLCDAGLVCDPDDAAAALFRCERDELIGLHVSSLLPKLTEAALGDAANCRRLVYLSHCGAIFNACRFGGGDFACVVSFTRMDAVSGRIRRLLVSEIDDVGTYRL